jgi:hypothetical protein
MVKEIPFKFKKCFTNDSGPKPMVERMINSLDLRFETLSSVVDEDPVFYSSLFSEKGHEQKPIVKNYFVTIMGTILEEHKEKFDEFIYRMKWTVSTE